MWWSWVQRGGLGRSRCAQRLGSGWLGACAVMGLVEGCLPPLSEPGNVGGEGGEATVAANAGSVGFAQAGRRGSAEAVASAGKGGSSAGVSTGGGPASAGGVAANAGGSGGLVLEESGGAVGSGGDTDSAGTSSSGAGESGGGSSQGGSGGSAPSVDQAEIEGQTIERWNAIADQREGDVYDFHWTHDKFPHPTFAAMGEAEGYREFGFVLDEFLGANFDFLAERRQFLTPYYYVIAPSDLKVTWDELASDFSTMSYGDIPDAVQARLAGYASDMKAYE